MYRNVEHISIRNDRQSPLANLDRQFFLYDSPMLNLCNMVWLEAIHDAARARQLPVLLTGQMGNMTISYDGLTLLPQLFRRGRWIKWLREGRGLVRERHSRWRGVLGATIGPYTPPAIWSWVNKWISHKDVGIESYSAINPERFRALQIERRARARALDVGYRPRSDGFESRLWVMRRVDLGNLLKGTLAGWGIDQRDPTTDRRLIEFCLSIPEEEHLVNGIPKALARRAFAGRVAPEVVQAREKGYQAADWYEGVIDARDSLREELTRLGRSPSAETALHLAPLTQLVDQMPAGGWETDKVIHAMRLKLLRGISAGHFLRRATGSNA
jgi:asparagine synthase (glutamine-hydrolysing)